MIGSTCTGWWPPTSAGETEDPNETENLQLNQNTTVRRRAVSAVASMFKAACRPLIREIKTVIKAAENKI